jgi:hypothetical protein
MWSIVIWNVYLEKTASTFIPEDGGKNHSETLVTMYKPTRRQFLESYNIYIRHERPSNLLQLEFSLTPELVLVLFNGDNHTWGL